MKRTPRTRGPKGLTDEEILQDMRMTALASPRGRLGAHHQAALGRYNPRTAIIRFGSWKEALRRALPELYEQKYPTPAQMIADLQRVAAICRQKLEAEAQLPKRERTVQRLSTRFYEEHGKYGYTYLIRYLGKQHFQVNGWVAMKEAAGIHDI